MDTDRIMQITYLTLLGGAIAVSYIVSQRGQMGKVAQQASIWGLIFVGVIAAAGMWGDIRQSIAPQQSVMTGGDIVLPRQVDGHFYAQLDVNGHPVTFMVDTGASQIVLSAADAARVGIDTATLRYLGQASTANGVVRTALVTLDSVTLGDVTQADVRAVVNQGAMDGSLLGMTYLRNFSNIQMTADDLILTR
ncbi:TIGR02281 family clan AA aspartic protease [Loktanella sp. M215]|nr:TIGR02281 family clan AA aspartic protease [Loktanella sp. M215]MCF7700680.1 TIGR02281 family clan AA aspartic protease [Loktanella sp. M215]